MKADSTFVHLGREDSIYYDEGCFDMIDVHPFTVMRYHPACLGVLILMNLRNQFIEVFVHRHCTGHYPISGRSGIEIPLRICFHRHGAGFRIQVSGFRFDGGDKKRGSLPWGWVMARKGTAKDVNRHRMH